MPQRPFTIATDPVVAQAEIRRRRAFDKYGFDSKQYDYAFRRWEDTFRRSRAERIAEKRSA